MAKSQQGQGLPKAKPSESLATRAPQQSLTTGAQGVVPDYLQVKGRAPEGGENVEQRDVIIPRLSLCQSMTKQRKKTDPAYIPGLEEGQFFNNVSGKNYGNKIFFVPVFFYRTRIRFRDLDEGGGILCQAQDGRHGTGDPGIECAKCRLKDFQNNESPECTEFKNFAGIVIPERGLPAREDAVVMPFKSSALKAANTWNTLVRIRGLDYYSLIFELTSAEQKNDKGTFYVPNVAFAQTRTDCSNKDTKYPPSVVSEEMYRVGKDISTGMKALQAQGRLAVDLEDEVHAEREAGDEENTEAGM